MKHRYPVTGTAKWGENKKKTLSKVMSYLILSIACLYLALVSSRLDVMQKSPQFSKASDYFL